MSERSIADINDDFRRGQQDVPGKVVMTSSISVLPEEEIRAIMKQVQDFEDFTKDNDPYGEHDFGSVIHEGQKIFWKIDYYDPTMTYHSEDKSDLEITFRVMTVMFASEY